MMRAFVLAPLLAISLAACGGAAAPSPSPSAAAPAASKPAAAPAGAKPSTAAGSAAKPATSGAASAAAKPATSSAASASAKPAASPASSGVKDKITFGYTSFTPDQLSLMVAKEQGFFDQNGIEAEVINTPAGSHPEAAIASGQIQGYEAGPEIVAADLGGNLDMEYVGAADKSFLFWLYSIPSVKTAADLKGKQIAVTSLTSSTYTAAKLAVKHLGLDPATDVHFQAVNNPPAIFAAMQNGAVQAGSVGSSNIVQVRTTTNFNMLVDVSSLNVPYPAGWYTVSKKWAESHDELMQRMMKSFMQGIAYLHNNPDGTKKILSKYSKNEDPTFLNGIYDLVIPHIQKTPYVDADGVKLVLQELSDTLPAAKTADPSKYFDNHWVKQLDDSGFINGLYK